MGGQELDAGADLHVVADRHAGDVEADEPEVREGPVADVELEAVLAPEGRPDVAPVAEAPEQLAQQRVAFLVLVGCGAVDPVEELASPPGVVRERLVEHVGLAGEHPVSHRACRASMPPILAGHPPPQTNSHA